MKKPQFVLTFVQLNIFLALNMSPSVINTSKFRQHTPRNQQHQNPSILANFTLEAGSLTEVFVSYTNKPL